MVEVTGELVKSAIAKKITEKIASAVGKTYKEEQHQNVVGDSFYIVQRRVTQEKQINDLIRREYEMIVRFEPDINSPSKLEKCADMGNILMFELKSIEADDGVLIHGINMNVETVDNVAILYVTYPIRIKDVQEPIPMMDLTINKEVNE